MPNATPEKMRAAVSLAASSSDCQVGHAGYTPHGLRLGLSERFLQNATNPNLGGHFKTGHSWTVQNRPLQPAAETGEFYFEASSVRKSVWTFVRQLFGPHLSTWA